MNNIWIISDTHLYHENFLRFTDNESVLIRGNRFSNVSEMNECIYDNWNETVRQGDIVYHLGDVVMGRPENFAKEFGKLPGRKRLIVGNHDDIKWITSLNIFQKISMWRMFPEHGMLLTHVPVHESSLKGGTLKNIIGHIHQNSPPIGPYVNLCVEQTNYTPVHIDTVNDLWHIQQSFYLQEETSHEDHY